MPNVFCTYLAPCCQLGFVNLSTFLVELWLFLPRFGEKNITLLMLAGLGVFILSNRSPYGSLSESCFLFLRGWPCVKFVLNRLTHSKRKNCYTYSFMDLCILARKSSKLIFSWVASGVTTLTYFFFFFAFSCSLYICQFSSEFSILLLTKKDSLYYISFIFVGLLSPLFCDFTPWKDHSS